MTDLDSTTLVQRITLLSLVQLSEADETPAHAGEIARTSSRQVDDVDADVVGSLSEAAVTRALNELEAADLVQMATDGSDSPVGKGRPEYEPEHDASALTEAFDDDDRLERLVDDL
jgi:predicted ArsR family transcriptional regulator